MTPTVLHAVIRRATSEVYRGKPDRLHTIQDPSDAQGRYRPSEAKRGHQLDRGEHLEDKEPDNACLLHHRLLAPTGRERGHHRECAQQLCAQRSQRTGEGRKTGGRSARPGGAAGGADGTADGGTTPEAKLREVEDLIIQIVIHHGEELITVKDSEQQDVELPVAQYIMLDMQGDGFEFHNPIYNKVLHEAVEHIGDEDFKAETYFANHPDPA